MTQEHATHHTTAQIGGSQFVNLSIGTRIYLAAYEYTRMYKDWQAGKPKPQDEWNKTKRTEDCLCVGMRYTYACTPTYTSTYLYL